MKRLLISTLAAGMLGLGTAAYAQSSKDETCNRTAKAEFERCTKRLGPSVVAVDPKNPTADEKKAMDKHEKGWKGCIEKSEKRSALCRK
jgi:hypothetical protein